MHKQITVLYSPICRAHENTEYFAQALSLGYGLQEISVIDLDQYWDHLEPYIRDYVQKLRREGGFIAAPLVFVDGKAVPAWKLNELLEEAQPE